MATRLVDIGDDHRTTLAGEPGRNSAPAPDPPEPVTITLGRWDMAGDYGESTASSV